MAKDQIKGFISSQVFTFKAGTIGGIFAGLVEVLLISNFGGKPANLSGLLFAVIVYGILGGVIGKLLNMVARILPFHAERKNSRRYLGALVTAATFSFILFLIFFFRAFRDFHAERVGYLEPTGLLTILVLAVIALALFFVLRLVFVGFFQGVLSWILRPLGYTVILAAFVLVGILLNASLSGETEEVHASFSAARQADLEEKHSVILIMVDTLRPDWLGCYGKESAVPTPNIDALARESVLFEQMYAHATHTKPSTASLLSSRYPSGHQAIHKTQSLPLSVTTLPEVMADAGYYCGGIVTNINLAPVYNFQQGFHEYIYLPPKFLFGANEAASRLVVYGVMRLVWMKISRSKFVYHFYRSGETVNGYFNDFIDRNKDNKFFLFLHYMDPHDPYFEHPYSGKGYARAAMPNPDPKFAQPFRDFYDQEVQYLDYWIGRLIEKLKGEGLYDQCMIALTSDHGEEFYEHGGWWHGATLHEEQVRVPLLIKLPGGLSGELKVETLTRSIDVTPTILAAVDVDKPAFMKGRDLFGPLPSEDFIPDVFSEADHEGNVVQMMRIGPWKYIQTNEDNPRQRPVQQLFYVPDDTWEENNLAATESDKVFEMQLLMKARYQEILATSEEGAEQDMDAATQERLRALGYTQ
jgi:arylsulfatase A-like enzyme